jgi:cold shock CspA family protein
MNSETENQLPQQSSESTADFTEITNVVGCVKWFNNRYGYGFISTEGINSVNHGDIFVHHSEIQISDPTTYKFLAQNECVTFNIVPTPNGKHKFQASKVTGFRGKLTCETHPSTYRRPTRRFEENDEPQTPRTPRAPRTSPRPRTLPPISSPNTPSVPKSELHYDATPQDGFVFPKSKKPKTPSSVQPSAPSPYKNALSTKKQQKNA